MSHHEFGSFNSHRAHSLDQPSDGRASTSSPSSSPSAATSASASASVPVPDLVAEPADDHLAAPPLPYLCLRVDRSELDAILPDRPRDTARQALDALDTMSRRIEDLARELKCLGYFDDRDPDRPRAA